MDDENRQLNQDLFDIIDSHRQDIHDEEIQSKYKISPSESKKMKLANFILNNKQSIKVVSLSLGLVLVFSSLTSQMENTGDKLEENNLTVIQSEMVASKNETMNEQNILIDDFYDNKTNDLDNSLEMENKKLFEVGNNQYIDSVYNYMDTSEYNYFEKNSSIYGIPTQIMVALGMQETDLMHDECLPNGERYNGCALGILQLEQNCNNAVTAYNYTSDYEETVKYSDEELYNIDKNIQVGCMRFQHALEKYNGNIYVAIQAHNYGEVMMDKALELTADDKNIDVSRLLTNYRDLSWLKYIEDIHDNPDKYLSNWEYDTYGDSEYLSKVLSYCTSDEVSYQYNGDTITFNLQYGISKVENNKHR